jgi:hypothetical protein
MNNQAIKGRSAIAAMVGVLALAGCGGQSRAEKATAFCKERMAHRPELTQEGRERIVEECETQARQLQTFEETERYKRRYGPYK